MSDVNFVVIIGRVVEKPVLRNTPSGTSVTTIRVANNTFRKNNDGTPGEKANFFDVVVWGKSAETCVRYLDKGRQIAITGRLEQRTWQTQDGQNRNKLEIIAREVQFLTPKNISTNAKETIPDYKQANKEDVTIVEPDSEINDQMMDFESPMDDSDSPF